MKQGPFIDLFSEVFGIEHKSVRVMTRALRDAGYLTTGARGVNAPDMTFQDAANLTVALLSGEPPSKINEAAQRYLGAKLWEPVEEHPDCIMHDIEQDEDLCAGEFLAKLFEKHSHKPTDPEVEPYTSTFTGFLPLRIEISQSSLSLSVWMQTTLGGDAHYLFYDFASHEAFAEQFPEAESLEDRARINTLFHEQSEKKGMQISRWITRTEVIAIAKALAKDDAK